MRMGSIRIAKARQAERVRVRDDMVDVRVLVCQFEARFVHRQASEWRLDRRRGSSKRRDDEDTQDE